MLYSHKSREWKERCTIFWTSPSAMDNSFTKTFVLQQNNSHKKIESLEPLLVGIVHVKKQEKRGYTRFAERKRIHARGTSLGQEFRAFSITWSLTCTSGPRRDCPPPLWTLGTSTVADYRSITVRFRHWLQSPLCQIKLFVLSVEP